MIIGSTAMKFWFPEVREPGDFDQFSPEPSSGANGDNFWHDTFPSTWLDDCMATPDELLTIKISHSFWEINKTWDKHAADILFLRQKGARFLPEVHDVLYPVWLNLHGKKKTNLNQNKDNFFTDGVTRKYDHDSIHDSVAYGERPLYESILKDGSEVLTDWDKFMAMDHDTQMRLMREEIYATALERICIPRDYKGSPGAAYHWALRRTATSLFKGKWALMLMRNYHHLYKPDMDYVGRHLSQSHRLILL